MNPLPFRWYLPSNVAGCLELWRLHRTIANFPPPLPRAEIERLIKGCI